MCHDLVHSFSFVTLLVFFLTTSLTNVYNHLIHLVSKYTGLEYWMLLNGRHISVIIQFFFCIFREKNSKTFSSHKGFYSHIIIMDYNAWKKRNWKIISFPRTGSNQGILFLVLAKQARYLYGTLRRFDYELIWILKCLHF